MHRNKSIKFLYRNYELVIFISIVILLLILKCYSKMLFILQLFYFNCFEKAICERFRYIFGNFPVESRIGVY